MGTCVATVNWCALGRCEVEFGDQGSFVVGEGTLCVSSATAKAFAYPPGRYRGFELFVDAEEVAGPTGGMLDAFGLSEQDLRQTLFADGLGSTLVPHGELAGAVKAIEQELSRERPRRNWLLLRVCELLLALAECDLGSAGIAGSYLRRSQRDLAQAVYQHLAGSVSPEASLGGLASRFGVSEASLRSDFSRVYGCSPASYARSRALSEAARLLAETDWSVADIGQACGYANPSKFSAAFRRAYDVNPLEYRRRIRLC